MDRLRWGRVGVWKQLEDPRLTGTPIVHLVRAPIVLRVLSSPPRDGYAAPWHRDRGA